MIIHIKTKKRHDLYKERWYIRDYYLADCYVTYETIQENPDTERSNLS